MLLSSSFLGSLPTAAAATATRSRAGSNNSKQHCPFFYRSPRARSLSISPSPAATTGRPLPAAQVPIGPFARSSSGSSPPTSSARYAHPSLPFLLCEAENPNPNLSYLSPDLIKLEMYTVFCLLTSFFLFCKNYLLHNYVLYCISFVPPGDREIQFSWFILLVYSCIFCYCDILCYQIKASKSCSTITG